MRAILSGLLLLTWPLTGCSTPEPEPICPAGEVPDEQTEQCVPEHCGTDPWGLLERTGQTLHVAPWGDDDWDGSEQWPYRTIQEGADEAGDLGGGLVAVAAGTYLENLDLDGDHDGVEIAGRCAELVVVDGSEEEDWAVWILGGSVGLRRVTVTGGVGGVGAARLLSSTALRLEDVVLDGNAFFGLLVQGSTTEVVVSDTVVRDTVPLPDGTYGDGIVVDEGASLTGRGLLVEECHRQGLLVVGRAELEDVTVRATRPSPNGLGGAGINVALGGRLHVERALLDQNHRSGLIASDPGTEVVLEDTTVKDTRSIDNGTLGRGIYLLDGADLVARSLLLEGNQELGLIALTGATVDLEDATIRGTEPIADGTLGRGIEVALDASLVGRAILLEQNHDVGLVVQSGGSMSLVDVTVRDTQPRGDGTLGLGVAVQGGASFVAQDLFVDANHQVGLAAFGAGSQVDIEDATIRDTRPASGGWGTGQFGRGLHVEGGPSLVARRLLLEGNSEAGLFASGEGTLVSLEDSTIQGTRSTPFTTSGIGLDITDRAAAVVDGLLLVDNQGPGLYADGGGHAFAQEAVMERNGFAGVVVLDADVTLVDSEVSGSVPLSSEEGGLGLFAWDHWGPPRVTAERVSFSELPGPALYLRGPGRYVVDDCTISGTGPHTRLPGGVLALEGVETWHEVDEAGSFAGLLLRGNDFDDLASDAVLLESSSSTFDFSEETGAANSFGVLGGVPVHWQRCDDVDVPEVLDGSTAVPTCESEPRTLGRMLEYRMWMWETEAID